MVMMTQYANLCRGAVLSKNFSNIDVCGANGPDFLQLALSARLLRGANLKW